MRIDDIAPGDPRLIDEVLPVLLELRPHLTAEDFVAQRNCRRASPGCDDLDRGGARVSVLPEELVHDGPWSEEEFFALPDEWRRAELLDGALLMSPSASNRHQRLSSRLWLAMERARPAGVEVLEAVNVRVGPVRILIPDIAVVVRTDAEVAAFDATDVRLVLEIVSRGSVATDRAIKPRLYAEAGIEHYVRIEADGPTAHVYRLAGDRYALVESGTTLRLAAPFEVAIDLPALLAADRVD